MRDPLETFVHTETRACGCCDRRRFPAIQEFVEFLDRENIGQIVFVVLKNDRHIVQVSALIREVVAQVVEAFEVRIGTCGLRIGDEHDAIGTGQNQLASGVEVDLPRYREEVKPHVHAANWRQTHREKIEVQRPIYGRCERHELAAMIRFRSRVNVFERGRLSTKPWPVVDDLENEFPRQRVYGRHKRTDDITSRGSCVQLGAWPVH